MAREPRVIEPSWIPFTVADGRSRCQGRTGVHADGTVLSSQTAGICTRGTITDAGGNRGSNTRLSAQISATDHSSTSRSTRSRSPAAVLTARRKGSSSDLGKALSYGSMCLVTNKLRVGT
jgi:hypothetical protein